MYKTNSPRPSPVHVLIYRQESGKLEYHLPSKFTNTRPGIIFTTAHQAQPISSHPLASQIPSTLETSHISVLGCMSHFNVITIHENTPRKLDDYLSADIPQLAIHVVTFTDTTLITVTFLHTVFDAMGLRYFLQAWTDVLSGAEDTIPPFLGFDEDTIEIKTEDVPPEQHVLSKTLFSRFQLGLFVLTSWWEIYWYPKVQDRILSIPHSFVQRLREKALQELEAQSSPPSPSSSSKDIFISDGDILLALVSKTLITALNPSPSTPVLISNVFDIRAVLGIADTKAGVYTSNATINACTPLDAATITQNPISTIALRTRCSLDKQRAPGQVHAMMALRKKALAETGYLPLVGVPGQISVLCTNWQRARFFELDFSAARMDNSDKATDDSDGKGVGVGAGPCRPTYINTAGPAPLGPNTMRNMVCITGRDRAGNWLLQVLARASAWPRIEEVIRDLVGDI